MLPISHTASFQVENKAVHEVEGAYKKYEGSIGSHILFIVVIKWFKFESKNMLYFPYVQDYLLIVEDCTLCCLKYIKYNMEAILFFKKDVGVPW